MQIKNLVFLSKTKKLKKVCRLRLFEAISASFNSKVFLATKNCRHKSKIVEFAPATV